ncbi:hypothetical protein GCM10011396_41480 [Undibacterium terreum]|uniref:Uncharacterized protein n=1 Tax=Undibacterium terreum TaxID=1224302 RepID=A0A916UXF6_9BURK|nr:hypothetical protein GCM10011396_41480 [Undibacterium terreum]
MKLACGLAVACGIGVAGGVTGVTGLIGSFSETGVVQAEITSKAARAGKIDEILYMERKICGYWDWKPA